METRTIIKIKHNGKIKVIKDFPLKRLIKITRELSTPIYKHFDVVVSVKLFSEMTKSEFVRNDIASDFFKTDYVGNIYVFLDKEDVVKLTELYIYLKECKTNKNV